MKKILCVSVALAVLASASVSAKPKSSAPKKYKIGISKVVQHVALDSIEQGIIDRLTELGVDAEYNLQNANGDVATASQIASLYKAQKEDLVVGIGTPVAVALANTIKDKPVVFSTVTDPVGAGLVKDLSKGYRNITGLSDAIPTKEQIKQFVSITGIKTLGYIYTSSEANSISSLELVREGCKEAGISLVEQSITKSDEVKSAAEAIINRVDGIYLSTDNTVFSALPALVSVFNKAHKPIYSGDVTGAMSGGIFMASGFNYYKAGKATGEIIYDILINGTKPASIATVIPSKPEDSDLLFDLDVAKDCGITIPQELLDKANMIYQGGTLTTK